MSHSITEKSRLSLPLQIVTPVLLLIGGGYFDLRFTYRLEQMRAESARARTDDRALMADQCLLLKELASEIAPKFRSRELFRVVDCGRLSSEKIELTELDR